MANGLMAAIVAVAVLQPAEASGAATVGSSLVAPGAPVPVCNGGPPSCTFWNVALPAAQVTAPGDGVVVRWRFRNTAGNGLRLRVLRNTFGNVFGAGAVFKDVGSSARVDVAAPSVSASVLATRIPVKAGDYMAIDVPANSATPSGQVGLVVAPAAMFRSLSPALPEGGEAASAGPNPNVEFLFNADVEPDADRDGFGDETQDQCPTNVSTAGSCPPSPLSAHPQDPGRASGPTHERLKAKLARCRKLKGKKAKACARRTKALARCGELKSKKKRAACRMRALKLK